MNRSHVFIEDEDGRSRQMELSDLVDHDRGWVRERVAAIQAFNLDAPDADDFLFFQQENRRAADAPPKAVVFDFFAPFVKTRWDDRWLYVESDGLPHAPVAHQMMVGIRAWQQQVPLPQNYTGDNAWRIPRVPKLADKPVSAKKQLFRGAIALAANGVPIFNPIKNDGRTDTFLAGELDEFGGHCGRADDYHYHIAPLALQKVVGKDRPIAYALDGYPIYGLFSPSAKAGDATACPHGATEKLDEWNGHGALGKSAKSGEIAYHYHASESYPYINGGLRGVVNVADDQIDPQPRATPVRDWLTPLRGAKITGFKSVGEKAWSLDYTLDGKTHRVDYKIDGKTVVFDFVSPNGEKKTESHDVQSAGGRRGGDRRGDQRRGPERRPQRNRDGRDRGEDPKPERKELAETDFAVSSDAVKDDGLFPAEFTCDGKGISPPLAWKNAPKGTKSFAVTMHHIPGPPRREDSDRPAEEKHVYWVQYGIPANVQELAKAASKPGVWGVNTVNRRREYAPPCSKGPGEKLYTITLYALSADPTAELKGSKIAAGGVTMDELLAAIADSTLGKATLDVTYERKGK